MSEHGAVLQSYNQELVKHIEHLKLQRDKITQSIEEQEREKSKILEDIEILNKRLSLINKNLDDKIRIRDECEKTLTQAETGLTKIIESSQVLLTLVQREAGSLNY